MIGSDHEHFTWHFHYEGGTVTEALLELIYKKKKKISPWFFLL
jgi:hypothetical protein